MSSNQDNIDEIRGRVSSGEVQLGNGAQFWAYISPSNDTEKYVTQWSVTIQQQDGNWSGTITSDDPQQILQTPGLSGIFNVTVKASGPNFGEKQLSPQSGSQPNIGCNSNCAAMVGIVATPGGNDANYWTTWDAICDR
jgi:hypothetical protein